jgi:hypothetical protein
MELTRDEINDRTGEIIDAAMKVHTFLGPGLLESSSSFVWPMKFDPGA